MSPLTRRSKMISFRISPEEYRMLQNACAPNGARNISELARKAMLALTASNGPGTLLSNDFHSLEERVRQISRELERIVPLIQADEAKGSKAVAAAAGGAVLEPERRP